MSASENPRPRPLDSTVIDAQAESDDLPFEIRVHGIGDHNDLSAMGAPHEFIAPTRSQAAVVSAPIVPKHRLRLVNWSHISRVTAKFRWFWALPFTLINAAGNMGHPAPDAARLRRILFGLPIVATGLVLSALMIVWMIAIGETILTRWAVD